MQSNLIVSAAVVLFIASPFDVTAAELAQGEAPQPPQQPQLAVDAKGVIHVVFGVGNTIRYCQSDDGGHTFSPAVDLPSMDVMSLGRRRGPRIAATNTSICVTAIGGKQGKGRDGDVLSVRSTDGGHTWTGPVAVNNVKDSAREGLHAMASGQDGLLCAVWLDLRNRKTEITCSTSVDGGATWLPNKLVYASPDGSVCECCHPAVTFDSQGTIYVQWRNSLAGARDMYFTSSSDKGKTFQVAKKLGTGTWPLKACPMDGGYIAANGPGKVVTVWRRENAVYLWREGQTQEKGQTQEISLGIGEQPWIAATKKGPAVVWLKKRGETAHLLLPDGSSAIELASRAGDPVIASAPSGHGPIAVAWESRDGAIASVHCRVVGSLP